MMIKCVYCNIDIKSNLAKNQFWKSTKIDLDSKQDPLNAETILFEGVLLFMYMLNGNERHIFI